MKTGKRYSMSYEEITDAQGATAEPSAEAQVEAAEAAAAEEEAE